jgi:general secretion pathway protein D
MGSVREFLVGVALSAFVAFACASLILIGPASPAHAQSSADSGSKDELVSLDFSDVELPVVIDTISRMTGFNFIYDDRVRGRVTIVSPTQVTVEQAFAVFESVLKVKGFSLVLGPGETYKVIPIRDVKESSIDTIKDNRPSPNRDRFVTRLVPLRFIDAEAITQTIKPLISKDASLVAYEATNTIIVTDSESNIRRLLSILDAIDVESYRQELAVIKVEHADASTLAEQLSEIYGAEVASAAGGATAAQRRARSRRRTSTTNQSSPTPDSGGTIGPTVRILPDERTNSMLVLASRQQLADIRTLVRKLDIPVTGEGRIQVYYLRHADAEELAETLSSLVGSGGGGGGARSSLPGSASNTAQSIRSAVTPLDEGITVTADAATNALVIKASKEGYETLKQVIEKLDISRPQVLVEALIVEVDITDNLSLGFDIAFRIINGDTDLLFRTASAAIPGANSIASVVRAPSFENPQDMFDPTATPIDNGRNVAIGVNANASDNDINIVSAPHILTSDNEEAEIVIGNNIPIVTGRTDAATGGDNLSQSVNVDRQDIGVTLRVTPQISEGDTLRLNIYQEITEINNSITGLGDPEEVGVALSNRTIENTVVVNDGETVAIGGLIAEVYDDTVTGVPYLKDIPFLGWVFKTETESLRKQNLLIFLTPHIIRNADDLERETIRKRLELEDRLGDEGDYPELADVDKPSSGRSFAVAEQLIEHSEQYPIDRMRELEEDRAEKRAAREAESERRAAAGAQRYAIQVATYLNEREATEALTTLVDGGYDGTLISSDSDGQIVFTIQVGPFDDLWDADRAAQTLDTAYGYESSVTVLRGEAP